jgi:negative regulator of flagellin synthesis FlgM
MAIDVTGINSNLPSSDAQVKDLQQSRQQPLDPNAASASGQNETSSGESDTVTLTHTASALQDIQTSLDNLPVVDSSRVAAIQKAISNGSFEIDSNRIAEKMLAFEQSLATDL